MQFQEGWIQYKETLSRTPGTWCNVYCNVLHLLGLKLPPVEHSVVALST